MNQDFSDELQESSPANTSASDTEDTESDPDDLYAPIHSTSDTSDTSDSDYEPNSPSTSSALKEADGFLENVQADVWVPMDKNIALNINEYQLPQTINVDVTKCSSPLDTFKLFIDEEIMTLIVTETNRYARQQNEERSRKKSPINSWIDTNHQEMYKFFGIIIFMGLVRCPMIDIYWSEDELFRNKFISSNITQSRFLQLLQHIHFNDNNNLANSRDHLFHIRPLLTLLNTRYQNILTPGKEVVIDQSIIPWRGYLKTKHYRYGVKLYKLCTLDGYTMNVRVRCGNKENDIIGSHRTAKVVMNMMNPLLDSGRILYGTNFYSNVPLVKNLQAQKTFYCGTLSFKEKGLPDEFIKRSIKRNEVIGIHNRKGLKIIKRQDRRSAILTISTKKDHDLSLRPTGKRNRTSKPVFEPKCIIDYNKAQKGVDLCDDIIYCYSTTGFSKDLKWYRKTAIELLLGSTLVNSYIVFNEANKDRQIRSLVKFREKLSMSLVEQDREQQNSPGTPNRVHTFTFVQGPGRKRRRNCVECYRKLRARFSSKDADKKVTKVSSFCANCDQKPAMCLSCFNEKHSDMARQN